MARKRLPKRKKKVRVGRFFFPLSVCVKAFFFPNRKNIQVLIFMFTHVFHFTQVLRRKKKKKKTSTGAKNNGSVGRFFFFLSFFREIEKKKLAGFLCLMTKKKKPKKNHIPNETS